MGRTASLLTFVALLMAGDSLWAGDSPSTRFGHTLVDLNGRVLLFGGRGGAPPKHFNDLWEFHEDTGEFVEVQGANPPPARFGHSAAVSGGKMYVFFGVGNQGLLSDIYCFDGKTWAKAPSYGPAPGPLQNHSTITQANGNILLFGGESTDGELLQGMWEYNPRFGTWASRTAQQTAVGEFLSNKEVLELLQLGLTADIIIAKIRSTPSRFDTSIEALKELKELSVPDDVILAMLQTAAIVQSAPIQAQEQIITSSTSPPDQIPTAGNRTQLGGTVTIPEDTTSGSETVGRISSGEIVFKKSKLMVQIGNESKERNVRLLLSDEAFYVKDDKDGQIIERIPYESIQEVVYERSEHARIKTAIYLSPLALFSKGKKHWLSMAWIEEGKRKSLVLKLDKNNYEQIISSVETKTGREIQRITGE